MILKRGNLLLECFPHPELDPATSGFNCGFRFENVGTFFDDVPAAGIPEQAAGWPRAPRPTRDARGGTVATPIDPADPADPGRRLGPHPLLRPRPGGAANRCARDTANAP